MENHDQENGKVKENLRVPGELRVYREGQHCVRRAQPHERKEALRWETGYDKSRRNKRKDCRDPSNHGRKRRTGPSDE
jgi:hypothetical protein